MGPDKAKNIGDNNVAIGSNSLNPNTTGSNNTVVGADASTLNGTESNCIVLGYNAVANLSNELAIGAIAPNNINTHTSGIPVAGPNNTNYLQVRLNGNLVFIPYYTSVP